MKLLRLRHQISETSREGGLNHLLTALQGCAPGSGPGRTGRAEQTVSLAGAEAMPEPGAEAMPEPGAEAMPEPGAEAMPEPWATRRVTAT